MQRIDLLDAAGTRELLQRLKPEAIIPLRRGDECRLVRSPWQRN